MAADACFNSALVDLEYVYKGYSLFNIQILTDKVKHLRIFHLCARKWSSDDASLGTMLVSIEDFVSKLAQDSQHLRLFREDDDFRSQCSQVVHAADDEISSFEEMINQWYNKFSNCSTQSWCSQDRDDELLELINTILEVGYLMIRENYHCRNFEHQLEALQEALIFLKNFLCFTTERGIDVDRHSGQNLLTHIKFVAVSAAYILHLCRFCMYGKDAAAEMRPKISGLLQKIKPVDPRVHEIYIQALNGSELSKQSRTATLDGDVLILEGFISSLLFHLFEILKADSLPVFSTKDQLQILDEGLRSLRTILKKQPKNLFDEKMLDLTGMVRDAGIVIFSLCLDAIADGLAQEMDVLLFDLLKRINLVRANVTWSWISPQGSIFNSPKADELRFIDFLLESLTEQTNCEAGSMAFAKQQIQTICEELMFLRPFLDKILKLRSEKEELQGLWNRVVELAYKVEFLIEDVPHYSFPMSFDSITEEIKIIKLDALEIFDKEGFDVRMKKVNEKSSYFTSKRSISIIKDDVVGLNDEATSVMDRLIRGASRLQIVAIVGMPGLGKTTLAKLIYNNSSIMYQFHICAWCCISQQYHKKSLLLEILSCTSSHELPSLYSNKSEEDLALLLYQTLKKKRYLIVLDDVWDIGAWEELKNSFPNDENGSRIILTSRNVDFVLENKLDLEPHFLRKLTDNESRMLLKAKLFPRADWPPTLNELRAQIVERCKGLPLTIVIMAGFLSTMEQDDWKEVVEGLSSSNVSILDECKNMLELSYIYLPDKLKSCFLYFGAFPEDYEHSFNELTWLWIAEGFVRKTQSKSLEGEAKDYLMHLINRNLVMVGKHNSTGGIKTCHIHDLLHVFCMEKAKEENFFQFFQGFDEISGFNESQKVRRLCILPKMIEDFKKSRRFYPRLHCLLFLENKNKGSWQNDHFNPLYFIGTSKLVRVLHLSEILLGPSFLDEIIMLVQLRYLAVQLGFNSIPSSIANLSNLETFIVYSDESIKLPNSIWNLKNLRHVKIKSKVRGSFYLDTANIDNSLEVLYNLETFSTLSLPWEDLEKTIKMFPNIRKLNVVITGVWEIERRLTVASTVESNKALEYLSRLESLMVRPDLYDYNKTRIQLSFHSNLRKLSLSGFGWQWRKMSEIGNLPNLEVLKLFLAAFDGQDWNMEEAGQFPKLSFLGLYSLDIVKWTASEYVQDHFPRLVKLVLKRCWRLEEIPKCLEFCAYLQMIVVSDCTNSVVTAIKEIEEEQKSMGNEDLKVVIDTFDTDEDTTMDDYMSVYAQPC